MRLNAERHCVINRYSEEEYNLTKIYDERQPVKVTKLHLVQVYNLHFTFSTMNQKLWSRNFPWSNLRDYRVRKVRHFVGNNWTVWGSLSYSPTSYLPNWAVHCHPFASSKKPWSFHGFFPEYAKTYWPYL